MAETPPGFIPLEQQLDNRAGLSTQPAQGGWEYYIGQPTRQLIQRGIGPIQELTSSFLSPTEAGPIADAYDAFERGFHSEPGVVASAVNPWDTPTQAGIMTGTALTGGAASAAKLPGAMQAASRVMGATGGGLVGGIAEGGAAGGVSGAGIGMVSGAIGEVVGKTADYVRQMGVDRVKAKMSAADATKALDAMKRNPRLGGVFNQIESSPKGALELVKGSVKNPKTGREENLGQFLLSQQAEKVDDSIAAILQSQEQQYGRKYFFPLVGEKEAGMTGTWAQARQQLSDLGAIAGKAKPHSTYSFGGKSYNGQEIKQLYAESVRAMQRQLALVDSQGGTQALQIYNTGRAQYEAGQYYLKAIEQALRTKQADRVAFNSDALQDFLAKSRKSRAEGINKLGEKEWWDFASAARVTPETFGMKDVYQPTGLAAQVAGVMPLPGAAYARVHVGKPQLVGNPLTLADASRTGISLGTNQMLAPIAQYLSQQMQGIPGLGQ